MTTYRGSLKLAHGENKILVAVTYQQKDGTKFTVSKEYTIYYDEEKLLIQTNLSDQTVKSDHIYLHHKQIFTFLFCSIKLQARN